MEKTKKITGKKQKKLSKITDPQIEAEQNDVFIEDAYLDKQQTQVALTKVKPVPAQPNQESVYMGSMMAMTSQTLDNQFLTAVEGLKVILASVQQQPNYQYPAGLGIREHH